MNPIHRTGYLHHALPNGMNMAYRDLGQGQAVVMLHGNPTWSYYYRHVVEALVGEGPVEEGSAVRFRVLVPDQIGMGYSDRWSDPNTSYSLSQRMDDFDHWLHARMQEQADPSQPIDLIVHDWGGAVGLSWAVRHPEKIRRIIILNTWAFNLPAGEKLPFLLKLARSPIGRWLILRFNAFARIAQKIAVKKHATAEDQRAWIEPYEGKPDRRYATWQFVKDIPLSPEDPSWVVLAETEKKLQALKDKPILIGWGMKDFVFTPKVLEIWAKLYPHAEIQRFQTGGHYVLEDEQDTLVPLMVKFLTQDQMETR